MEIRARKALAFHHTSVLVCSFFPGGRKSSKNQETQGKGTVASYQLPSRQFPATFLQEAGSFLSASGMQAGYSSSAKAISPSIVLPARNPITEQCACISREQRGKMRTRSLCIPLHLELLSCYIPVQQEYRVRLAAVLTSTRRSLPPAWQQSLLCYSSRKGTTEKGFCCL